MQQFRCIWLVSTRRLAKTNEHADQQQCCIMVAAPSMPTHLIAEKPPWRIRNYTTQMDSIQCQTKCKNQGLACAQIDSTADPGGVQVQVYGRVAALCSCERVGCPHTSCSTAAAGPSEPCPQHHLHVALTLGHHIYCSAHFDETLLGHSLICSFTTPKTVLIGNAGLLL